MLSHPEIEPNITAISFEIHTDKATPERVEFLYDPEEQVHPTHLNDPKLDCNARLAGLLARPDVKLVSVSISMDHPIRALVPINPALMKPDTIGDVFRMAIEAMAASGEFVDATPDQVQFLHMAELVGHSLPQQDDQQGPSDP